VAVSYGALLVLEPGVALASWIIFLPLVLWTRRTSIPA
jgi:glycerol-3-phosphate acyltransferase PlsY